MRFVHFVVVVIAFAAFASSADAQPPGATPPNGPQGPTAVPPAPPGQKAPSRVDQVKRGIRIRRDIEITTDLNLDQATAGRLAAVMARYDEQFDRVLGERADLQRKLNNAGGMKDPHAIEKLIDDAVANQRAVWDVEDRRLGELRKVLTPQQTARLLVLLPALERRLQNQLQNAVRNGGGQGKKRGNRNRPPGDDDDDE